MGAAALAPADPPEPSSISSSCVHIFSTAASMSVTASQANQRIAEIIAKIYQRRTFLADEWKAPAERVHEVGQPVWVWHVVELPDAEHVRLVLDHGRLVVVHVQVVWRGEERHDAREPRLAALAIHPVPARGGLSTTAGSGRTSSMGKPNAPSVLSFVRADDGQQAVAFQKLARGFIRIKVRAAPHVVVHEVLWALFLPKVLDRIRPQYVAHEPGRWWLTEPVQLRK